ncbi:MAG: UDP-2,3-diacylglucosamine diphosphatase LpxI [Planctomycetes bacterium]|jgi:DUF1009 family protein|nr:UDP-2,3-diacylglucosamine diphosphatase LpxI [Planctomycetota bacterium]
MREEPIGLIAGGGRLPVLQAQGLRAAGRSVACVGFRGMTDPALRPLCDRFVEIGYTRIGGWVRCLRRFGARQAIMVGTVNKADMYLSKWAQARSIMPDPTGLLFWFVQSRRDRRSQAMLTALADLLDRKGIELIDTTAYIPDHLASEGVMTARGPTPAQQADIDFGWPVLMRMNDLDIGQAIALKDRNILAVEAIEGTAQMITRAGGLCRKGGWTLLKGPDAEKDLRFDVPSIGLETIAQLEAAGATCLAVAAGKVILMDKPQVLKAAEKAGIAVVGIALEA